MDEDQRIEATEAISKVIGNEKYLKYLKMITASTDDIDVYDLIMKSKELLDCNPKKSPVRSIFSHSALHEGWDNPHVFRICTLKQSESDVHKRQEVGRGLRLFVNQDDEMVQVIYFDMVVNGYVDKKGTLTDKYYADKANSIQMVLAVIRIPALFVLISSPNLS